MNFDGARGMILSFFDGAGGKMIFSFFDGGGVFIAGGIVKGSGDDTAVGDSPLFTIASMIADTLGFDAGFVISGNDEKVPCLASDDLSRVDIAAAATDFDGHIF